VYVVVCPETFPYDASNEESADKCALQEAHRQLILTGDAIYATLETVDALSAYVLALQEQAIPLRVEQDDLRTDVRRILELLPDRTAQPVSGGDTLTPQQRFDGAVAEIAEQRGVPISSVRAEIDGFIDRVRVTSQIDYLDRALAEFAEQRFAAAAANAERA